MFNGKILLKREDSNFEAGFCFINKDLSKLLEETSMLHPSEISYFNTLKYDKRKHSYLLGRIAAKNAISEILITKLNFNLISIEFGVFEFPVVKHLYEDNIQVTISHCDNYGVAVAFPEEHPLGTDIAKINEGEINIMKSVICNDEFVQILSCSLSMSIGITLIFTVKESLSKILRTGLTIDFKILEIELLQKVGSDYISTFKNFNQYKGVSRKIGDHICSIVLPKNTSYDLDNFWKNLQRIT